MRIFRSIEAPVSPVDPATFLGQATVQRLAHDETGVAVGVYRVTFSDGGRTNWHKHAGRPVRSGCSSSRAGFAFKWRAVTQRISKPATPSSWRRANGTGTAPFRGTRARTSLLT